MEFCMEWNEICRVCLQEGTMQSIFDADEKNLTHSDKIMICANVKIERGVNLPEQICVKCLENLNAAYNFRNTCKKSDNMLQSFMQGNVSDLIVTSTKGDIVSYKPPEGLKVKRMKTVVKLEPKEEPEIEEDLHDLVAEDYYEEILGDDHIESNSIVPEENHTGSSNDGEIFEIKLQFENGAAEVKSNKLLREIDNEVKKKRAYHRRSDTERKTSIKQEPKVPGEKSALKICEICGNIYKHKHAFETHMRRHRNEKPFSCEICGRAFVLNVELRCHMRRHTGDKPYACRFCDRKFSDFGSRIKHERSHTGERPYPCTTCGKAFAYSYGLSSHMLTHTGEKPFNCELCRKRFTKKHHLKAHLHTHKRRGDYVDIETMLAAQPKPAREYQANSEEENAVAALEMVT